MKEIYEQYICDLIQSIEIAEPIYVSNLSKKLANNFSLPINKAVIVTASTLKRILDSKLIEDLRFYQKGIYYRTRMTPFGEVPINKNAIIIDKYIKDDNGYDSDLSLLHKWGFTTQIPNERVIVTNRITKDIRKSKDLSITLRKSKLTINKDNIRYLQILDILNILDKAPVDVKELYKRIAELIAMFNLSYEYLLFLASEYYNENVIGKLTKVLKA